MSSELTEVVGGLGFLEAPRWHEGELWFSDFHSRTVTSMNSNGDFRRRGRHRRTAIRARIQHRRLIPRRVHARSSPLQVSRWRQGTLRGFEHRSPRRSQRHVCK